MAASFETQLQEQAKQPTRLSLKCVSNHLRKTPSGALPAMAYLQPAGSSSSSTRVVLGDTALAKACVECVPMCTAYMCTHRGSCLCVLIYIRCIHQGAVSVGTPIIPHSHRPAARHVCTHTLPRAPLELKEKPKSRGTAEDKLLVSDFQSSLDKVL